MKGKFLTYLSLIALTCAPVEGLRAADYAPVETLEYRKVAAIDVVFETAATNVSYDPKSVLNRLDTKVGDPFSQLAFDKDLKVLSEEYDRVEPVVTVQNGEVYIVLKVWPRPSIRTITWSGNEHMRTKRLQSELGVKLHSVFNRQAFNKAFNKVKEYYVKRGYFESQLSYTIVPDPKTNEVDIQIEVHEGRSGKIENIIFKGFTAKERSQLLGMVYTKKYNLFTSWLSGKGHYSEEALEQDKLTIINFMQNRGYADAKVDIRISEAQSEGKILIEISVNRGVVYHFGKVSFKGNTLFTCEQVDSVFVARPGGIYSPDKLHRSAQNIKDLYGRKGYIDAEAQYETQLAADKPEYSAQFSIDEGDQYKIGLVRIFGNVQTQSHVILRESLLVPGETFDCAKLKATQQRLENIGYFKSVNVYAVRTQDDQDLGENYRDVYIEVEETTTGNVSLFVGFSSADNVFGGLDLSESNFNYKGFGKLFSQGPSAMRGGGEYAHARVNIGAKQRSYSISWVTPYFRDTLWRVGFDVTDSHSTLISKNYDINTLGFSFFASYPITNLWSFGTKYRFRNAMIHVSRSHTTKYEREETRPDGIISGLGTSLTFDSTDSALKPHRGFRSLLEGEFVGIGGDFTFLRFGYLNSYYTPLWSRGTMKYRFDFRFIQPILKTKHGGDLPLSERFFIGGINSVRGYRDFDLGKHFHRSGDPEGGISATVLSLEYMQELLPIMDVFLFVDAGSIAMHSWYVKDFKMSTGIGTRLELINRVPVILGYGYPINPSSRHEQRRFFFSMGGQF